MICYEKDGSGQARPCSDLFVNGRCYEDFDTNTHSLQEENYQTKLQWFVDSIIKEKPDIIALQEVNQTADAELMGLEMLKGQCPIPGSMKIRLDNHVAQVAYHLHQAGIECYWIWQPVKLGYEKYDEGLAILSIGRKIRSVDKFPISKVTDYKNWHTRVALGVQVEGLDDWFYSLHLGWWDETEDNFLEQWKILNSCIAAKRICGSVWLLGDFNAPDRIPNQSYEHMLSCGWIDTYQDAQYRDCGITVDDAIDGWQEKLTEDQTNGMRMDYILCNQKKDIFSSRVMFNGMKEPVVSDHFGVLIEVKEK